MIDLSVDLAGVRLQTPLIAAAGTCGYGAELGDVVDLRALGAVVTKSITVAPREGNPPWRLIEVPRGMMNAIGLANVGLDGFINEKADNLRGLPTAAIGSIAGESIDDYVTVARRFDELDVLSAVELNVSCPNTDDGLQFGANPGALRTLIAAVRPELKRLPLIVKLSPNVTDIVALAEAAIAGGASALCLINTMTAMSIDVNTRKPRLSFGTGGLSGPAIHPVAVRMVHDVYHSVARDAGIPIIGLGGVLDWTDAAEFILAGASAVGIGTGLFVDSRIPVRVRDGLERWVGRQGCSSVTELVGALER